MSLDHGCTTILFSEHFVLKKNKVFKRTFDIVFALSFIVIAFPVFIIVAIITKITSKGSIIFTQERTGQYGKKFLIYKFRSMKINADEIAQKQMGGELHFMKQNDPRITGWGNFIRKTHLDEFPQFFNVLKGDMSVVGPRPLANYDSMYLQLHHGKEYNQTLQIKPGITSIGQLNFGYAHTYQENAHRMTYDLKYIPLAYSLLFDCKIILKTIRKVLLDFKNVFR